MLAEVGDIVKWEYHGKSGKETVKIGQVIKVIPSLMHPTVAIKPFEKTHLIRCKLNRGRVGQTYFVEVLKGKTERSKPRLYWPRSTRMSKVW